MARSAYPGSLEGHNRSGHKRSAERGAHADHREARGRKDGMGGGGRTNEGRSETGIQGGGPDYKTGRDASYIEPRLIPDYELLPRDDSGGPEWMPYTAQWGDGGYVTGEKAHLSARGGRDDAEKEDEISSEDRSRAAKRAEGEGDWQPKSPRQSRKESEYEG